MDKITVVCHKDHDKGYEDFQGKCLLCVVDELMLEIGNLIAIIEVMRELHESREAAVRAENEACAKVLDEMANQMVADMEPSTAIAWVRSKAAEIRARRKTHD